MNFIEQAAVILRSQDSDRVAQFLEICDGRIPNITPEDFGYIRSRNSVIEKIKSDMKALTRLKERHPTALQTMIVDARIQELNDVVEINNILNTGGKPTDLTHGNLTDLYLLSEFFRYCFPALSQSFSEETLLGQLATALVEKPIPKSVGEMMERDKEISGYPSFDPP
jgi:hypothetical protein